jgi:hypothetical protein
MKDKVLKPVILNTNSSNVNDPMNTDYDGLSVLCNIIFKTKIK